jgi:hypothetical protein
MVGQPITMKFIADIDARGGEEWLFDMVADGKTVKWIMETHFPELSRAMFYRYIYAGGEERDKRFKVARKVGAGMLIEEALEILDDADATTKGGASKAKAQAAFRQWLAGKFNKEEYGDEHPNALPAGTVLNIGQLHLHALRSEGSPDNQLIPDGECIALPAGEEAACE